ncbi:MAG: hypothetical protein Q9198_000069 [Flavoplaca austrocitrina]
MDGFRTRFAQSCDVNNPADVGIMLHRVRDFMQSLYRPGVAEALLADTQLLEEFCDYVSRDGIFGQAKMIVHEFRTSMHENIQALKRMENEDTAKCLVIILSRLEHDGRLPPRFQYGSYYLTEAELCRDRQKRWIEYLLMSKEGLEPGSGEEARRHEEAEDLHRRVESVIRRMYLARCFEDVADLGVKAVSLAAADNPRDPTMPSAPFPSDESGNDEDEMML